MQRLPKILSFFSARPRKCSWRPDEHSGFPDMAPKAETGPFHVMPEHEHPLRPDSAAITLVEYGDYQCRPCGEAYIEIESLRRVMADRLRFIYRHFPYAKLHPQAELAAEAAEAAAAQGKFWEMHDLLFRRQNALREKHLLTYPETLGLNAERFCWELKNRVYRDQVRLHFRSGVMNGVYSTPAGFINGVRHPGALRAEALSEAFSRINDPRSGGVSGVEIAS